MVLGGGGGFVAWKGQEVLAGALTTPDYAGPGVGEVVIKVSHGDTASAIAEVLEDADVVKSSAAFTRAAKRDERSLTIQPGHYRVRQKMSGEQALEMLLDPEARVFDQVTVPEGLRVSQTLERLAKETDVPLKQLRKVAAKPADLALPHYAEDDVEGFLFPATYRVEPDSTATELLQQLVGRYDRAAQDVDLMAGADRIGYTAREVVTVASLVEKEARRPDDFPRVARVIYNRLAADMQLEFDSTVHYALDRYDRVSTSAKDRQVKSPYNTYLNPGLPPGPIAAPGERALKAALRPADGDWLFFVTTNPDSGLTRFSETYGEHQKYVREYNKWCQENKDRC